VHSETRCQFCTHRSSVSAVLYTDKDSNEAEGCARRGHVQNQQTFRSVNTHIMLMLASTYRSPCELAGSITLSVACENQAAIGLFPPVSWQAPSPNSARWDLPIACFSDLISACPPDRSLAAAKQLPCRCRPTSVSAICGFHGRNRGGWIPRYLGRPSGISCAFPSINATRMSVAASVRWTGVATPVDEL
jgi:hypothetical protein